MWKKLYTLQLSVKVADGWGKDGKTEGGGGRRVEEVEGAGKEPKEASHE